AKMEYDKEIEIYKEALLKITDRKNIFIGYAYNNLGRAYAAKNDFKESMKYFEIARKIIKELDKSLLSHNIIEKSEVLLKQNLFNEAIETAELGLKYAEEFKDVEYLLKGNYLLSDVYNKQKNYKNLESTYLKILKLLDTCEDKNNLKLVYTKLALMYLKQGNSKMCEKYLLLSINLN
ncbi:MAG: hypothetical protein PHX70_14160, partial [Clostridium sp.]|nr:hypothetical protein [Clostridium sp.]